MLRATYWFRMIREMGSSACMKSVPDVHVVITNDTIGEPKYYYSVLGDHYISKCAILNAQLVLLKVLQQFPTPIYSNILPLFVYLDFILLPFSNLTSARLELAQSAYQCPSHNDFLVSWRQNPPAMTVL